MNAIMLDFQSEAKVSDQGSSDNLKSKVHSWLTEEGWDLQEVSQANFAWAFVAEKTIAKLNVAQPKGKFDLCIVRIALNLVDAQSSLSKLSQDEVDEFLWELKFELARLEVEFEGVKSPLAKVAIYRAIYSDGLTKNSFADTLGKVLRASMILQWLLTRRLGKLSASESIH